MGELLICRRGMILPDDTPILPAEYKQTEYTTRPNSLTSAGYGWNSTGVTPNGTDTLIVRIGLMLTKTPSSSEGATFLGNRQNKTSNTYGFGITVSKNTLNAGAFDGRACNVQPLDGASLLNTRIDLVVTKTPTDLTVTDGTHINTVTGTPRAMANALQIFSVRNYNNNDNWSPAWGRIYYLQIFEAGVLKCNLVPCKRISDSRPGFYDTVQSVFRNSSSYTNGPEV